MSDEPVAVGDLVESVARGVRRAVAARAAPASHDGPVGPAPGGGAFGQVLVVTGAIGATQGGLIGPAGLPILFPVPVPPPPSAAPVAPQPHPGQ